MTLSVVVPAVLALVQPSLPSGVTLFDGPPTSPPLPGCYGVLGSALAQPTATGVVLNPFVGGCRDAIDEYDVLGYFRAESGDTTLTWARNQVDAAFTPFRRAIQLDPSLGGVLTGSDWALLSSWDYTQTSDDDLDNADEIITRWAHIDFHLTVHQLITTS